MTKTKTFYLIIVLVLLAVSDVMSSGIACADEVPDGFVGIPWGANRNQITNAMRERGYNELISDPPTPDTLEFEGAFAGYPCMLMFKLTANSFYWGIASSCAKSPYRDFPQRYFERVVNTLSKKYGPPAERYIVEKDRSNITAAISLETAKWALIDNRTLDKYSIDVNIGRSWFSSGTLKYSVGISYQADSLMKRLEMKEF